MHGSYYPRTRRSLSERFWSKVDQAGDCWLWTGATAFGGYGQIAMPGPPPRRPVRAHRVAWALTYGPIPDDAKVLHRCDNPRCVRPDHLWLGTMADNSRDMVAKGRNYTGSRENVPRGDAHWRSRLTEADIPAIREASRRGESYGSIGRRYGVQAGAIRYAVLRETWRHVP